MADYGFAVFPFWGDNMPLPEIAVVWNFTYIIVVNVILTAIFSGIIIDSFSAQRMAAEFRKDEQINVCFICSIEREDFERYGTDFNSHIKKDHNMWNYIKKKI